MPAARGNLNRSEAQRHAARPAGKHGHRLGSPREARAFQRKSLRYRRRRLDENVARFPDRITTLHPAARCPGRTRCAGGAGREASGRACRRAFRSTARPAPVKSGAAAPGAWSRGTHRSAAAHSQCTRENRKTGRACDRPAPGGKTLEDRSRSTDELQQRVRFREVKTRALKDPAVQSEWDRAQTVRTDYEKREALKSYYTRLYTRMAKIDRSLKKRIAEEQGRSLARLTQTRVDPTEPLDPQERLERAARE